MRQIQGRPLGPEEEQTDPYVQLAAGILARALDDLMGRGPSLSQRAKLDARLFLMQGAGGLFELFGLDPGLADRFLGEAG